MFTTSPINSGIYNNSTNQFDQKNGNRISEIEGSYPDNVYTTKDSDDRYPVKAIDGTNANISLDTKYRIQSDGTNLYIQRIDDDGVIETDSWVNVVSFTCNTNTNTSSIFMNGIDIQEIINQTKKVTKSSLSQLSLSKD